MQPIGLGIPELLIVSCVCLVPLVIVVGVVLALLVVLRRREPKAESGEWVPQPRAPVEPREPRVQTESPAAAEPLPTRASAVAEPLLKSCSSCGADNPVDNAICEYCGASLAEN